MRDQRPAPNADSDRYQVSDINPTNVDRTLTPQRMAELADNLTAAVTSFREWGVRVHDRGRVWDVIRLLRSVAEAGSFPERPSSLVQIGHAASDAQELAQVAWVLPQIRIQPVVVELQRAVAGVLGMQAKAAYQAQSELWVGAMFAHSDTLTAIPTMLSGKSPDYVLRNGDAEYSVEVKRPAGNLRASKLISEAAAQLRGSRYHGAGLVVDLTDCIASDVAVVLDSGPPKPDWGDAEIETLTGELFGRIFDIPSGHSRVGRDHFFALVTFARLLYWDRDDLSRIYLDRKISHRTIHPGSGSNLRAHRARWLARLLSRGMERVGYEFLREEDVSA